MKSVAPILVGFESSILDGPMTGVANYTFNIVKCALELDADLTFSGFKGVDWHRFDRAAVQEIEQRKQTNAAEHSSLFARVRGQVRDRATGVPGLRALSSFYREMRRRKFASSVREQSLDLFHAFNFRPLIDPGIPVLPVIYDLSTFRYPEFHPGDRVKWLEPLQRTIERAPLVQTISDFSRNEISDLFGYPHARIFVAPPAAASLFAPMGEEGTRPGLDRLKLRYGDFLLVVGTHEPRKNIRTVILAYARLTPAARARCPLVLAGRRGWGDLDLPEQTAALVADGSVRFVHDVTDPQLRDLYEGARLLLAPSLYEGFGMPVVEALACGTPVAHSTDTAMDEISGNVGRRVGALDVDAWTSVLNDALDSSDHADPSRRAARIACAHQFDWQQSAGLVVDAYRRILRGCPSPE